jgi:hypothetical protein
VRKILTWQGAQPVTFGKVNIGVPGARFLGSFKAYLPQLLATRAFSKPSVKTTSNSTF